VVRSGGGRPGLSHQAARRAAGGEEACPEPAEGYAAIAGIRKAVRPSLLRHTFAVLALVRGEDYEAVKLTPSTSPSSCSGGTSGRRLGHEIDDVMQQYVQRAHQLQVLRRRTT